MKHRIRQFTLAALLLAVVPAAQAQFSDMLRSLSGALRGGGGGAPTQHQQGTAATIGIRGIDEGGTVANAPASEDNMLLDGWMATRGEATRTAGAKGLAAQKAFFRSAAPAASENQAAN
jgi:hypothetical protein